MRHLDTIVIGAGQAGLAMSRNLTRLGLDHVLLEGGQVGERWRRSSWDSLRLLTPNWMTRLPDFSYRGSDPDGFMKAGEFIHHLERYAETIAAPVIEGARVVALEAYGDGYRAVTDRGHFSAPTVVIAAGASNQGATPTFSSRIPNGIFQLTAADYRNPDSLPAGGVLVVGASSSGVQIARELRLAGRAVTIAAGRHNRLPRTYRGRDILWWLDRIGVLDERFDQVADIAAGRAQPSLQLVGSLERRSLDLPALQQSGIRVVGRVLDADGQRLALAAGLEATIAAADAKMHRLLDRIDLFAASSRIAIPAADRPSTQQLDPAPDRLDLAATGIASVVWATGYRRDYSWLRVPILDASGELRHEGGVGARPGIYVLGLRFMRRRKSSFIDGAGPDAADLSQHLAAYLRDRGRLAA